MATTTLAKASSNFVNHEEDVVLKLRGQHDPGRERKMLEELETKGVSAEATMLGELQG